MRSTSHVKEMLSPCIFRAKFSVFAKDPRTQPTDTHLASASPMLLPPSKLAQKSSVSAAKSCDSAQT